MFQNLGIWDWIIILALLLLLFGGKKLPELAKALGKSISAFKSGMKEGEEEIKKDSEDKSKPEGQ